MFAQHEAGSGVGSLWGVAEDGRWTLGLRGVLLIETRCPINECSPQRPV